MWELLGFVIEGIIDIVSDLLEEGDVGDPSMVADSQIPTMGPTLAAPIELGGLESFPMSNGESALSAFDGGISPDRFDPAPPAGPFTP